MWIAFKVLVFLCCAAVVVLADDLYWAGPDATLTTDLALRQVGHDDGMVPAAQQFRILQVFRNRIGPSVLLIGLAILFFAGDALRAGRKVKAMMLRGASLMLAAAVMLSSVGCMREYDTPEYIEIETHETAFLIPLEGDTAKQESFDSEEFLRKNMIAKKRIQIPHRFNKTGRMWYTGEWIDNMRVVKVDRTPITREWRAEGQKDQGIWVESKDSVGFSTGISCTARIKDQEAAIKFLFNYPSKQLEQIMDTEIRARIQSVFADMANNSTMNELRDLKNETMIAVKEDVIPFFAQRGIEITTIGQFGGYTYENKESQLAIDKVFQAQQGEEVAKAEEAAQREKNKKVLLEAEGKAQAAKAEAAGLAEAAKAKADGEAAAIRTVAEANKFQMEQVTADRELYLRLQALKIQEDQIRKWDGMFPRMMMGGQGNPAQLLLQLPDDTPLAAKPASSPAVPKP